MKRKVRLTESDLHRVIKESVRNVLNEYNYYDDNEEVLDYGPAIYDDGTTLHDARTFGKSYEEIQDDERRETLNYKKRKNDNYEVYRYMNSETLMYT